MSRSNKLLSLLNILPGEGRLVLLVMVYAILLYTANVLARTASYALFLAEYDAATLPYTYIGVAVVATLVTALYLKLNERLPLGWVLISVHAFLLLTLLGYWLGLGGTASPWLLFSLPIYFGVNNILTISSFWNLLGRLYNLQQGKRLFGLLTSGENLATIGAGFVAPVLVAWLGTPALFLIAGLVMAATLAVLLYLVRSQAGAMTEPDEEQAAPGQPKPAGNPYRDHYLLLIMGLFALFIVGIYFVDNIFYGQLERQYPDEDQMAAFIGLFFGVMAALSLGMQLFVAGRVVDRFGVRAMLVATPAGLLVITALFALTGTLTGWAVVLFWLAAIASQYRLILDAIDSSAVNLLYQPLPARQRTQVQTTVSGIIKPLSLGLTGLILLFLSDVVGFGPVPQAYVLLVILAAWLAAAVILGREYPKRVQQALKQRRLRPEALARPDRTSLAMLQEGLASPQVGVVIYSLELLEAAAPETLPAHLPGLLEHPEREVRLDTLRRIERLGLASAAPLIQARLRAEGSRAVQGASLRALASLGDAGAFETIYPYLDQSDPYLRQGALVGLLRSGELEGILAAGEKLNELVKSPRPAERELAAQALGEAASPSFYRPLLRLLRDEAPPVRRAALVAAGKVKQPKLWPAIIEGLASPQTRGAAAEALVAGGEAVLPELAPAFQQEGQNREALSHLARVAGRIGGAKALAWLEAQLNLPDAEVRYEILRALSRGGYQARGEARARFEAGFKSELEQGAITLARLVELAEAEPLALLRAALAGLLTRHRERLFLWLACLFDGQAILPAGETLSRTNDNISAEQQSYALEVLETQLPLTFKTLLRPWLDDLSPAERLQRLSEPSPQPRLTQTERLAEIITGPEEWLTPWTRVCALHAVGQLGLVTLSGVVITALDNPQPLLRQTAAWTLARLDGALYEQYAPALRQDSSRQMLETLQAIEFMQTGEKTMLTPVEKVIRLKAVDFLAEAPEEVLAQAAAYLEEIEVKAGETILAQGETGKALYLIVEGQVRLPDSQRPLGSLGENEVFGELSILNPTPQPATVTALSDVRLLRLEQEALRELLEDHSQVAWSVMQRLAQRLQRAGQSRSEQTRADLLGGLKERLGKGI